jgi:Tfp pilus assembly protein PilX
MRRAGGTHQRYAWCAGHGRHVRSNRVAGVALPGVLAFALAIAMLVAAALHQSTLEARGIGYRKEAAAARNFAEATLELLVRSVIERWPDGGEACAVDDYCAADFPRVEALLSRAPAPWAISAVLVPSSAQRVMREDSAEASSARAYRWRFLEAQVRIAGPAPVAVAAGLALPLGTP